ncbi:hypothetical protein [Pleionea sp. CnH1-48]|uniref:hypothetical protein n=1 Tax=Pleionea sp. CnH1-48 TaxID=2954494 RepID=UPI002097AF32|nr:hypothetical protein [Pleionea sp. CnH1-48]MCO7226895.1 hypothetical protein [Pleionea sp. CnH1-48]
MFSKWFGKKEESVRILERPEDLQVGDMFEMVDSFGLPAQIRGKSFKVTEVNTYEYQREKETEFLLEGPTGEPFFMTVETEDGEHWINFSMKVERDDVESLVDMDAFSQVFDENPGNPVIKVQDDIDDEYDRWVSDSYRMSGDWTRGFFLKGDYRNRQISRFEEDGGEPLESVSLVSDDDMFSIQIEVWSDGDTEVFLIATRPASDIKSLFGRI